MSIKEDNVRYIARLARIKLSEKEVKLFSHQLDDILAYVEKLNKLNIQKETPPMSHPHLPSNPWRVDEVKPSVSSETALKNAPQRRGDFFQVPKIIED